MSDPQGSRARATEAVVPAALDGERLDRALAALVRGVSRSRLQRLVKDGHVQVDGAPVARVNTPVQAGSQLRVDLGGERRVALDPGGAPIVELDVLHEDEHLIVVDKPAGLISHPNVVRRGASVAELAEARWGPLPATQGADRPGVVHRLDRLTSGVMVLARSAEAMTDLMQQFRLRTVEKRYLAIVHGVPRFDSEWIDAPIATDPRSPDRRRVATAAQRASGEAREAETYIEVRERFEGFALVECRPRTGRTHQLRVHLQHAGLPIVGDRVYRHPGTLPVPLPADVNAPGRQALHAASLELRHPGSGERRRFEAPLAPDLQALLDGLRG